MKKNKYAEVPFILELPDSSDPRVIEYQSNPQDLSITFRNHGFTSKYAADASDAAFNKEVANTMPAATASMLGASPRAIYKSDAAKSGLLMSAHERKYNPLFSRARKEEKEKNSEANDVDITGTSVPALPKPPNKLPEDVKKFPKASRKKPRRIKTAMQVVDEVFNKVSARMRKLADEGDEGDEYGSNETEQDIRPEDVYELLRDNPHLSDQKLHDWSDYKDYDKEKVEEMVYRIAAKNAAELIPGGKAEGKPASDFPSDQIQKGVGVEKEHTPNPAMAKEIAKDHLEEFPNYYTALDEMETKLKKSADVLASEILKRAAPEDRSKAQGGFKSKKQWRKFFAMENRGELPEGKAKEWARDTTKSFGALPARKRKKHAAEIAQDILSAYN
jgi:hypothetical protein